MRIKNKNLSIIFKVIIVLCGLVGIELSIKIGFSDFNPEMFRFYTNLSNIFVLIYFICSLVWLIKNRKDDKKVTFCPLFKGMQMMAITLTMLVVIFILRVEFTMNNTMWVSLLLIHYLVPIFSILDWLMFDEKGLMKKTDPLLWAIPPIAYIVYAMTAARIGDGIGYGGSRYPYPFLDIDVLGTKTVVMIIVVIAVLYIALGYVYYAIDRALGKKAAIVSEK